MYRCMYALSHDISFAHLQISSAFSPDFRLFRFAAPNQGIGLEVSTASDGLHVGLGFVGSKRPRKHRIPHSGSKAQNKEDTRSYGL